MYLRSFQRGFYALTCLLSLGLIAAPATAQSIPGYGAARASCESIWIERNRIMDRHGYCFRSPLGKAVFNNANCRTSSPRLSKADRYWVNEIKKGERRLGCRVNTSRTSINVDTLRGTLRFGRGGIRY